jgi:hypothetical protein
MARSPRRRLRRHTIRFDTARFRRVVITSEAKQSSFAKRVWIASSLTLLAMTAERPAVILSTFSNSGCTSGSRGVVAPESCGANALEKQRRARGMPGEGLTHGPRAKRMHAAVTTGSADHPAFPVRWVTAYTRSPWGPAYCPLRQPRERGSRTASAPGGQDHTISPSASKAVRRTARCGHRFPASRVVTIAIRPSCRGGMAKRNTISVKEKDNYFCAGILQRAFILKPLAKLAF